MKRIKDRQSCRRGSAFITVMGMTLLAMLAASAVAVSINSRVRLAQKQLDLEQAFYIAAAGAERSASYVAAGNETSTTLRGNLGAGNYVATITCSPVAGGETQIDVSSVGTVRGTSRTVTMRGLRRVSWARYALWYDSEVTKLWMFPGERFGGRVYSRPQFHFHDQNLATKGQVVFSDKAWSAASSIEKSSSAVNPIFQQGLTLNATMETMASVSFSDLLSKSSSGGLVLEGESTLVIEGQVLKITNSRKGWSNKSVSIPANGLIYVKTATSGSSGKTANVTLSSPTGLSGRLTIVAENDIKIANHVRYKENPQTNPASTDALGLIAQRNIEVQTSAPNNLDVYAHLICQKGGFGVANYNSGSARGTLTVFGGIVNLIRNAVNTNGGATGYAKNYIYDTRFAKNPPPNYPVLTDELEWRGWEG